MGIAKKWNDALDYVLFGQRAHKKLAVGLAIILVYLGLLGIIRLAMEIAVVDSLNSWALRDLFYVFRADTVFTMFFFVIFLCFFSAAVINCLSKRLGGRQQFSELLKLLITLQFVHLIIPLGDYLGAMIGMPSGYEILTNEYLVKYYLSPALFMTPGVILGWLIALFAVTSFLIKKYKLSPPKALLVDFIIFMLVFWPTYMFPVLFNAIFDALAGIKCATLAGVCVHAHVFWGYGIFFAVLAILGMVYSYRKLLQN